ncbi:MAG: ribosome small subunit-dependent GTPase A [Bacteroidales bacterium]|nr:ribosome small subunit-dependent GTPase A [Bacteroidales bacterium]
MIGIVTRSTGSWHMVSDGQGITLPCKLKGNFRLKGIRTTNPVAVGDKVEVETRPEEKIGTIVRIFERNNYIIRKATKLSKESHIIAANIDQLVLVATLAFPRTSTGFIDRVLVTAEAYHIPAIILFNKTDLYTEELMPWLEDTERIYQDAGYPVLRVSARTKVGMDEFIKVLKDKVSLISGHSGVGKSSLINVLQPGLDLKIMEISSYHLKGQHATTFPEMHALSFGGYIIDTPGIKEFGLTDFNKNEVAERFPEMRALMHLCRYSNCTHTHEPGCEVIKAVQEGKIHPSRYDNYQSIFYGRDWNEDKWN